MTNDDDDDDDEDVVYYQAFPCVRVVTPGAFSIGPHCDASYGHHPCSVNFYVPLTDIVGRLAHDSLTCLLACTSACLLT